MLTNLVYLSQTHLKDLSMKPIKCLAVSLLLVSACFQTIGQTSHLTTLTKEQRLGLVPALRGTVIPMKILKVTPPNAAEPGNDVDKISDGKNYGETTQFHTSWKGITKQDIILEAELEGAGKKLTTVALDQRYLGRGGIITKASLWVMKNGKYKKVANIQEKPISKRVLVQIKPAIKNPEKVKLVVTDAYSDNGNYMVCLGEMTCLTAPTEKLAKASVVFVPNYVDEMRQGLEQKTSQSRLIPAIKGKTIKLSNFKVTPTDAAAAGNGPELLADGINSGDYTEFHTPWGGMQAQEIILEADMDGKGRKLDKIILDQRHLGLGGIITQASIFVMQKGAYVKVADFDADIRNGRLEISPAKKIKNPEKIKLVVTDSSTDNGNFMVCLGEMTCTSKK